jgi:hypothetical protein
VEILKQLCEAVRRERPEVWPNYWILHHDNAPAHKKLHIKHFLAQKLITEMEHLPCSLDLAPYDFWLFPKIKSAIKGQRFQDIKDIQKMWLQYWMLFNNRSSRIVSDSGSSVGL